MKKGIAVVLSMILVFSLAGCSEETKNANAELERKNQTAEYYTGHDKDCICDECAIFEKAIEIRNAMEENEKYGSSLNYVSVQKEEDGISLVSGGTCEDYYKIILHYYENAAYVPTYEEAWSIGTGNTDCSETSICFLPFSMTAGYSIEITNNPNTEIGNYGFLE